MVNLNLKNILKNWRVLLLAFCVLVSLLLISNIIPVNKDKGIAFGNGLEYGLDFAGGVQMQLELERPVDSNIMSVEKEILEHRLNAMGLRDIPVRPWGNQYILIQIAGASPTEIKNIEDILKQQARFEARMDGELAMEGSELTVDLGPQGSGVAGGTPSQWFVSIQNSKSGGERFCSVGADKKGRPIDMFLDRPENTVIVMANSTYGILNDMISDNYGYGDSYIKVIENRSLIPVIALENSSSIPDLSIPKNYTHVIIAGDENQISDKIRNELEEINLTTEREPKTGSYDEWVQSLMGLQSSPRLNCDPCTQCKYNAQITGTSSTLEDAKNEIKKNQILLTSGNLPAKATIISKSTVPPTLGAIFLKYSFLTGIVAIFTVAFIIFLRYRKLFIVVPVLITGLSEIIIILGVAALIKWEIDLPAVAGILASVGTGVDNQIVITDETMKRGLRQEKVIGLGERIRRAFFIIFTAAATIIAVMLPIMSIGAGLLKGFAFITILGVLIGIFITRPAYSKVIEDIVRK